jgi:hypothetical protein
MKYKEQKYAIFKPCLSSMGGTSRYSLIKEGSLEYLLKIIPEDAVQFDCYNIGHRMFISKNNGKYIKLYIFDEIIYGWRKIVNQTKKVKKLSEQEMKNKYYEEKDPNKRKEVGRKFASETKPPRSYYLWYWCISYGWRRVSNGWKSINLLKESPVYKGLKEDGVPVLITVELEYRSFLKRKGTD